VTYNGAAAPGIDLRLRFYDSASWSTVATATTDLDGRYRFTGVQSLGLGQVYYVRYDNDARDDRYVAGWYAPDITSYTEGQVADGGSFDIANVALLLPEPGVSVSLPAEFGWAQRGLPGESYRWRLFDPDDTATSWTTNDLGDVGSYTLTELPSGAVRGKEYGWYVLVYQGADNYGGSYYYRRVTFP
jgi:hypothetical protein